MGVYRCSYEIEILVEADYEDEAYQNFQEELFKIEASRGIDSLINIEEIPVQLLPSPDEAPITSCPHCGEEYNVKEDDGEELYEKVPILPVKSLAGIEIFRHKKCGKLVQFISWASERKAWA